MHPWTKTCYKLLDLVNIAKANNCFSYEKKLLKYINASDSEAMIQAQKSLKNSRNNTIKRFVYALLELKQSRRLSVFKKIMADLAPAFPLEVSRLEIEIENLLSQKSEHRTKVFKLYKYLKRIDGAIQDNRYSLAVLLANRCLHEYYRYFLTLKCALSQQNNYPALDTMSIEVVKYIINAPEREKIPYSAQKLTQIALVTNTLSQTGKKLLKADQNISVDKGVAVYYRENLDAIVQFLVRFL